MRARLGAFLLAVVAAMAAVASVWTPYGPLAVNLRQRLAGPGAAHWLGTDEFGRDVLSRVMTGASISLSVGIVTVGVRHCWRAPRSAWSPAMRAAGPTGC